MNTKPAPSPPWSEEEIEAAAQAMCESFGRTADGQLLDATGPLIWEDYDEAGHERFRKAAAAALDTLVGKT